MSQAHFRQWLHWFGTSAVCLCLTACTAVTTDLMNDTSSIDILNLPLDQPADTVREAASQYWGADAVCERTKTGVGLTRKAFLLETCEYQNATQKRICDVSPSIARYQFLEDSLVQITFVPETVPNDETPRLLADCVSDTLISAGYRAMSEVDEAVLVRLSTAERQVTVFSDGAVAVSVMPLVSRIMGLQGSY